MVLWAFASGALAQTPPPDEIQRWHGSSVAFAWPMPFTHVPQTFTEQAVRFTAPFDAPFRSEITQLGLNLWFSSGSADNFNDTLRVRFLGFAPSGAPDDGNELAASKDLIFAELEPGSVNTIPLHGEGPDLAPGENVWVAFGLIPVGQPDTLVMVSDVFSDPPIDRSAAFVEGEGWRLLRDTQFTRDYEFHVSATFSARLSTGVEEFIAPGGFVLDLYPNPTRGSIRVDATLSDMRAAEICILDLLGRETRRLPLSTRGPGRVSTSLSLDGAPPGLYVLQLRTGGRRVASRPLVLL
jgi:hypothetical protein